MEENIPMTSNFEPMAQRENDQKKFVTIILIALVVVVAAVFVWKLKTSSKEETSGLPTPIPTVAEQLTLTPTPTTATTITVTPTPIISPKAKLKLQVLNGTGITGEAAYLKGKLKEAGYLDFILGNAETATKEASTQVNFYASFPKDLRLDLLSLLQNLYATVSSQVATGSSEFDVVITTGKRK